MSDNKLDISLDFDADEILGIKKTDINTIDNTQTETINNENINITKPLPSLNDLPKLGTSYKLNKVEWGPNMKKTDTTIQNTNTIKSINTSNMSSLLSKDNKKNISVSSSKAARSSNIQEVFTIDLQSQLSITKPEYSRIVQNVKQTNNVSIESTLSKNSRTFLISGKKDNVREARRFLLKKLTKPIEQIIQVPSNCRSAIIGSGGKNIREIIDTLDVKINVSKDIIPNSYDDELGDSSSNVSIFGDIESVNLAKLKILKIVNDETKFANMKIDINDDQLLPLITIDQFNTTENDDVKVYFNIDKKEINIVGLRDDVKKMKLKILNQLDNWSKTSKEEIVKIPSKFQILINSDEIKQKFNVSVTLDDENDLVKFFGSSSNVNDAIDFARSSSKIYSVDSLDISKSHGKNLNHAKNLILYFTKYTNLFDQFKIDHPNVKIHLPTFNNLLNSNDSVIINITGKSEFINDIKLARKDLISLVNTITPFDTMIIDDLDYDLFNKDIKYKLTGLNDKVHFIQLGDYYPNDNHVVLFAINSSDDFKPSADEVIADLSKINSTLDPLRSKQNSLETKIYDIASDIQDSLLLTKSTSTHNLILNEVSNDDGNVQIKIHTPINDQITLRGDHKGIKIASAALDLIISSPSLKSKLSFNIPSNSVARLIGNKGSNLQKLSEKFNCHIDVEDSKDSNSEVTLIGLEYNLNQAKIYITNEAKKWADIITKELIAQPKFHRRLMGQNASYRDRLQEKFNVSIFFPKTGDNITIRGPTRNVNKAYDEMKALLDYEMENGFKSIVNVPVDQVAMLIGKSGEHINDIRDEFGVQLDFLQNVNDEQAKTNGSVELEITGSRQAIKEATQYIENNIKEVADYVTETMEVNPDYHRIIIGSNANTLREMITKAGGDEIRRKNVQIPNAKSEETLITIQGPKKFVSSMVKSIQKIVDDLDNSITKEIDIPNDRIGAVIGPSGSTRLQLETEFNVKIDFPPKNDVDGKVKITGLPANVEKAEKKIFTDIIKNQFDAEILVPANYQEYVSERGSFIQTLRYDYSINVRHPRSIQRANNLSRAKIVVPDGIRNVDTQDKKASNFVTQQITQTSSTDEEPVVWRLFYEPLDMSLLDLGEEETKPAKKETPVKKEAVLKKVTDLIQQRIEIAKNANTLGYLWYADNSKFRKVVGVGGRDVKKIRESTGTVINVPKKTDSVNDVIYIRGTKEGVEKAHELIMNTLSA